MFYAEVMTSLEFPATHVKTIRATSLTNPNWSPIYDLHPKWNLYTSKSIHCTYPIFPRAMPTSSGDTSHRTCPILLLKTKSAPRDGYHEYFSSVSSSLTHRYEPRFIPVLEHKYHDANLATVKELCVAGTLAQKYGGLIFTSQRAVEGFGSVLGHIRTYVCCRDRIETDKTRQEGDCCA